VVSNPKDSVEEVLNPEVAVVELVVDPVVQKILVGEYCGLCRVQLK